jgi:hypothetical protein
MTNHTFAQNKNVKTMDNFIMEEHYNLQKIPKIPCVFKIN